MAKKRKKIKIKSKKKFFKSIITIALIAFIGYNLINFYIVPDMSVIAQMHTIEVSYEFDGIISRDEETIEVGVKEGGILDSEVSENQMVKKGSLIATYFESDIDETTRNELKSINKKIAEIKATPSEDNFSMTEEKLAVIIDEKKEELIEASSGRDVAVIKMLKDEITSLAGNKTIEVGEVTNTADTLEGLLKEKANIESRYGGEKKEIISPVHGIFSSAIDGYEEELTVENSLKLTVSDYHNLLNKNFSLAKEEEKRPEIKLIDSFKWAVSVCADEKKAKTFSVGEEITVKFSGEDKGAKAVIEYISPLQSGKYIITAVSNTYSEYAMTNRLANLKFVKAVYSGLRVPVDAIRVKDGVTGVYVKTENTVKYKNIDIIYKDNKDAIAKMDNTKMNALLLYDEIIVN